MSLCIHPECEKAHDHAGRHTFRCDDGSCCEPPEVDAERVAEIRERHFGYAESADARQRRASKGEGPP